MFLFGILLVVGYLGSLFVRSDSGIIIHLPELVFFSALIAIVVNIYKKNRAKQAKRNQLKKAHSIINTYAQELCIRRSQLTVKLAYGLIDEKKWLKEIELFVSNVIQPAVMIDDEKILREIVAAIYAVTDNFQSLITPYSRKMSPIEYENLVTRSLVDCGWDARVTVASGDQGIDVIAEKSGIKVVIQCKLYSSNVGNAAVQEIIAGQIFENADFAAVVSNVDYTKSARQLASSSRVFLLHHDQLEELEEMCEQPFWQFQ